MSESEICRLHNQFKHITFKGNRERSFRHPLMACSFFIARFVIGDYQKKKSFVIGHFRTTMLSYSIYDLVM